MPSRILTPAGNLVTIWQGDCRDVLDILPDESVHCVVTSPPYWGLRDYGVADAIGIEPTISEHMDRLVAVFRDVRRVLRSDGTLWLNYGDAYCSTAPGTWGDPLRQDGIFAYVKDDAAAARKRFRPKTPHGLKAKDLMLLPERLALALQADGWWVRARIIWQKPNPMPESVTDRPTKSHEHIWLLSKSPRYFYDADAVREAAVTSDLRRPYGSPGANALDGRDQPQGRGRLRRDPRHNRPSNMFRGEPVRNADLERLGTTRGRTNESCTHPLGKNLRDVWTIAPKPFKGAHFATFPPALAERCIRAGCPPGGIVLDPFGGSGTTAVAADALDRNAVLIELNPHYVEMARNRVEASCAPKPSN